jgi:hypothetical protein
MFAMAQAAARERSPRWLVPMLLLLPATMIPVFLLRPPNVLYALLLVAMLFVNGGVWTDRPPVARVRLLAIVVVVGAVTLGFGVPHVLREFGPQVREGLSVSTLSSAVGVLFSVEYDTLLNPRFTPPGITVLALLGIVDLLRRKRWRLVACLGGWLLASLVTHAYVVPKSPFMQARYHLHLVLPFVCLAACGIEAVLHRIRERRRAPVLVVALFAYVAASPAIHLRFVRDVDFDDQREWVFVHALRPEIPAGCTIVEYVGEAAGARFDRVGAHVVDGMPQNPWTVVEIPAGTTAAELRAVVHDRPQCMYWYEGLPCAGHGPPGTRIAPECAAFHDLVPLEQVAGLELVSRPYDENLGRALEPGQAIAIGLYRMGQPGGAHSSAASDE